MDIQRLFTPLSEHLRDYGAKFKKYCNVRLQKGHLVSLVLRVIIVGPTHEGCFHKTQPRIQNILM